MIVSIALLVHVVETSACGGAGGFVGYCGCLRGDGGDRGCFGSRGGVGCVVAMEAVIGVAIPAVGISPNSFRNPNFSFDSSPIFRVFAFKCR